MPKNGIGKRMAYWWYLILLIIDLIQTQNLFDGGGGFLPDPFLELTSGLTTPTNQKLNKTDSSCISNGTLAGSIIATLLLSALIAFLTWMVYLKQKLQELRTYENRWKKHLSKQTKIQQTNDDIQTYKTHQLPLDVIDYKFGTFPFRQSQTHSINGHCNSKDWLNRIPSSFRSVTTDQDTQTMDVELLNPTFCGLNFSITGNMRAGIFIKEILDKETSIGQIKLNSSDKLHTGDRIIALTVCFESIVYEDALTILSYASPYPVVIRVQRPMHSTQVNIVKEKRPATVTKVKWRDDLEHYDNDTPYNRSVTQVDSSKTLITELPSTSKHNRSSSKKSRPKKSSSSSIPKGNKLKTEIKHSKIEKKKKQLIKTSSNPIILTSTGLSSKPIDKISTLPISSNKTTAKKSVTNAVISYLHYRDSNDGKYITDTTNNSEATLMPYYDSPYDYYGTQITQSNLNNNNNNNNKSSSIESLNRLTSIYTLQLSSTNTKSLTQQIIRPRRCERRLSSPAILLPITIKNDISFENIDTLL